MRSMAINGSMRALCIYASMAINQLKGEDTCPPKFIA